MTASTMLLMALVSVTGADSRWLPFLGCWTLVEDEIRESELLDFEEPSEEAQERPAGLVCLSPEGDGVRVQTYSGDDLFLEEGLVADGSSRDLSQGNCRGWQRLDWSSDAHLLFTRSELTCEEGRRRFVSGISMMAGASTWVEIQSVGSGDAGAVTIRRYRPAGEEVSLLRSPALTAEILNDGARARAGSVSHRTTIDDVIEAAGRVAPETVEAMLLERGGRFPIDRESLLLLSDASVSPRLIDLMVALTFPEKFEVERAHVDAGSGLVPGYGYGYGYGYGSRVYDPFFSSAFAYPYYFAPFGYYYWYAPWDPVYAVRPIVLPGTSVGRVVEGRGYTRVIPAEPDGGGRRARHRGDSGSSDWSTGGSESSSSGGGVSPQGYSRGGSEGRTAKPKKN